MATADYAGQVYVSAVSRDPNDPKHMVVQSFSAPATNTVGALADKIATATGASTGSVSLMRYYVSGTTPVIDARASLLSAASLNNYDLVVLVAGS